MTRGKRFLILGLALAVFATALVLKEVKKHGGDSSPAATPTSTAALPRLLDLGSDKCVPCKLMAPILEELREEYDGRMRVEFVDVRERREIGAEYGLKVIPTQIFFAADGTELYRHEGFMSREDILAKWNELGVDVESGGSPAGGE
jgi:thioredoxin 1